MKVWKTGQAGSCIERRVLDHVQAWRTCWRYI